MSLPFGQPELFSPPSSSSLHRRVIIPSRHHHRAWRRRRFSPLSIRNDLNSTPSQFGNLFHTLLSQFPSVSSLNYIAPTLGFASGLALFLSSSSSKLLPDRGAIGDSNSDIGEWILFTSPTPFNRFVTLRCPSIYFPGNELLEDVNERLVKEDRHYVTLNSGRMVKGDGHFCEDIMVYQRICVPTEDGGVLSLDWPANLDVEEERGMDTTVLIVPGTPEGSNERKIRAFVCECLRRGVFPVVMNPRGCAGSPLTTARLFTAADSDDISTAVQFVNKRRPWTTLMGVGWGYGANMLTKYMAEFGERTPLTAATCIDNPFDLEEATRSSHYHMNLDKRHTNGLIEILRCNKELFQGRGRGFDVERALSASSIREFENSISMVSHGFDDIEDFYAKCSTRDVVGKLKIPVLFIQNDNGEVPLYSVPRGLIAENPYTSLLLCSYSPSSKIMDDKLTFSWCQHLTLEWLTTVELGLLKGRHPLLKDVDVAVNPSKGLKLVESRASSKRERADKLLTLTNGNSTFTPFEMLQENKKALNIQSRSMKDIVREPPPNKGSQQADANVGNKTNDPVDGVEGEEINAIDTERGQVLQTAQVVMNMLDMTMAGTLSDEQKKKVLSGVGQGETLIKALQDAVPEDVRRKLTTAVSAILQSQKSNLKFDKLLNLGHIPDVESGSNSKVREKARPAKPNADENVNSLEQKKKIDDPGDDSTKDDLRSDKPSGDLQIEKQSSENSQKASDSGTNQSTGNGGSKSRVLEKVGQHDTGNSPENEHVSGSNTAQVMDRENINADQGFSGTTEGPVGAADIVSDQKKVERESDKGESDPVGENNKQKSDFSTDGGGKPEANHSEDKSPGPTPASETQGENNKQKSDFSTDGGSKPEANHSEDKSPGLTPASETQAENNKQKSDFSTDGGSTPEANHSEDKSPGPTPASETQVTGNDTEHNQRKEEKNANSSSSQGSSDPSPFSVSQALDALTGFDDSTQYAVNSVFNVIEDMIDQFEEDKDKDNDNDSEGNTESKVSEVNEIVETKELSEDSAPENHLTKNDNESTMTLDLSSASTESVPSGGGFTAGNFEEFSNDRLANVSSCFTFPYGDPLYKEYLKNFLRLKMRNAKLLDKDKMSTSYLDYVPEEGQWKLVEHTADGSDSVDKYATRDGGYKGEKVNRQPRSEPNDYIIEPSYVILDSAPRNQNEELNEIGIVHDNIQSGETDFEESKIFIKNLLLECLNVEVGRRASAADMDELGPKLAGEIEWVANAVSLAAGQGNLCMHKGYDTMPEKVGTLDGEKIIEAISSALHSTQYLSRVMPVGVAVGASFAALRKFFNVAALDGNDEKCLALDEVSNSMERLVKASEKGSSEILLKNRDNKDNHTSSMEENKIDVKNSKNQEAMVGAVTAALGASALLAHQQITEMDSTSSEPLNKNEISKQPSKLDEIPEKNQNIVTSLAEKAMSVASPVMPIKEDGGLDHERLVVMLTELGQKGGMLKLVGKVALLWGGIRGAMSLTDKLILFLRIAERPLLQRILGFTFLVLLLWSPVVLPLLPTLMQSWATHNPSKIVEFACIAHLYISVMIMITLWGKRIRKYDDPLSQYGLDLSTVPKFQNFLMGLVGGFILVILIHVANCFLGCAHLSWPSSLSLSSSEPVALIKSYGWFLFLIVRSVTTASVVSVVEELLFRSWLTQEIAADFGYHRGIVLSAFTFALSQRSTWEIPGLCLLSLSLSGAQQRSQGSLSLPLGLRSGILASNFILKLGGFLTYQPNFPLWVTGAHPFQPFSGVVGLAFSFILAVVLYPRQQTLKKTP